MLPFSLRASIYQTLRPGALSGQLFADLCDKLLLREAREQGIEFSTPSDRAGDYKGLDSYANVEKNAIFNGFTGKIGFQYKFVPSESAPMKPHHKKKIESSLKNAADQNRDLRAWILITPEDFDKHQEAWLQSLKRKYQCRFSVKHWGQKQLSMLIIRYPDLAVHIYPDLVPTPKIVTLKDMCSRLVGSFSSRSELGPHYIRLSLSDHRCAEDVLLDFAKTSGAALFCLLGGYGTGKTTTLEHFAMTLAQDYINGSFSLSPILVRLRHVRGD